MGNFDEIGVRVGNERENGGESGGKLRHRSSMICLVTGAQGGQ